MAEILNLDELSNVVKQFQFKGEIYDICEISLGDFIALSAEQKALEAKSAAGGISEEDMMANYRKSIMRMIPNMTGAVLDQMTVRQLKVLLDFINSAAIDQQVVEETKK